MPGTIFGLPFDEEIFMHMWSEVPDPVKTAFVNSGAMVNDSNIASQLTTSGNFYTVPFYNVLGGDPQNYDGQTDIVPTETDGAWQSGIAFGRARAYTARNFAAELSGGDPMGHIAATIGKYWNKQRQAQIINILNAVCITGADAYTTAFAEKHIMDFTDGASAAYTIGETDFNDVATAALGDNKSEFSMVIMHSKVAQTLENKQLIEFWKQTDANGIQRPMNLASINGYTVLIDDGVPMGTDANNNTTYTSYLLGSGVLRYADARIDVPVETSRDPLTNGGQDTLITRNRQTIHPNGFSYTKPAGMSGSPTDAQLGASANWSIVFDPKAIPLAKIVTNG